MSLRPSIINLGGESVAGCSIREEGLRAAALPGRVAAADAVALDAGPRADERVGHIYQSVFGFALWLSTALLNIGGFIVGPPGHQAL